MPSDFDLRALWDAVDATRRARALTWSAVCLEVNGFRAGGPQIAMSTIAGLKDKTSAEGDGVLQMLRWLQRTPESFLANVANADDASFEFPAVNDNEMLRWDARQLYDALNAERQRRALTWQRVADDVGGCSPAMLTKLAAGGRVAFPGVMRMVQWLGRPAAQFIRAADWV